MEISAWSMLPFGLMLLMIAVGPLFFEKFWESNRNKLLVSLALGIPAAIYLIVNGLTEKLIDSVFFDYVPFIVLLTSLFVVTGGIYLNGDIKAKPTTNVLLLAMGWILASFMGTTGAAMLLIRPVISINQQRKFKTHTILFFIALVANCGGLLTPLGDPPLFMLFLRGAPFTWFFSLFVEWIFTGVILLMLYFLVDSYYYKKEDWVNLSADAREISPIKLEGKINFIYLLAIVLTVAFINKGTIPQMGDEHANILVKYLREIILLLISLLSYRTTSRTVRFDKNKYTWTPIIEVAYLFLGIFTTMTPALLFLEDATSSGLLPFDKPWHFYYATGLLSSFLDNTPTAVAFHSMATGLPNDVMQMLDTNMVAGIPDVLLRAICIGAVMFGAMTYIGNGPNFMIKSIAEENKISMPSFLGYMFKFSFIVLLPVYILVQLIFI